MAALTRSNRPGGGLTSATSSSGSSRVFQNAMSRRECRIGGGVALHCVAFLRAQRAQDVFGRAVLAHGALSMQSRSFARPRLTHSFTVSTETPSSTASWS